MDVDVLLFVMAVRRLSIPPLESVTLPPVDVWIVGSFSVVGIASFVCQRLLFRRSFVAFKPTYRVCFTYLLVSLVLLFLLRSFAPFVVTLGVVSRFPPCLLFIVRCCSGLSALLDHFPCMFLLVWILLVPLVHY